jgi:acyl-CoA synthetase (NDP forming)
MPPDARRRNLERLLNPACIAVVGGRFAEAVIEQTRKTGFTGRIHAVNPRRKTLAGISCLTRIEDLPEPPDAVFLGIGREATIEAAGRLAAMGAGGCVCYAAGFAEAEDGAALQRRLVEAAGDMALLGPNCYGLLNLLDGVALWPDEHGARRVERGVALITQSGNIGITLSMQERSLPIACIVSVGNQAQLAVHDLIDVLTDDARITAIGLYLEAVPHPIAFARAALRCAARRLPIVAIKAGRSETGASVAHSHTSSLAGADAVVDAFLRRYGIVRVESLADLLETLKLLHVLGPLPGRQIGSLSCSGGDAAMVADLAASAGLVLPPLPDAVRADLAAALGPRVALANPLDYHTYIWADLEGMTRCFAAVLGAGFDATLLVLDYPRPTENDVRAWDVAAQAMTRAATASGSAALVVSSLPETLPRATREQLLAAGIAPMQGLPECLRAIASAARLEEDWQRLAQAPPPLPLPEWAEFPTGEATLLGEHAAKSLLVANGVRVPAGEVVPVEQAAAAAARIGFPVALKTAAAFGHKSEAGGVVLGLATPEEVAAAAAEMARLAPHVLVERMLPAPVAELIVGVRFDPQFGPYLLLGAGGTLVELWQDTALLFLPVLPAEVRDALRALRIMPVLEGYRGREAADLDAAVEAIGRIGALAVAERHRLVEIEVNPLMVYSRGEGAIAADAVIRLRPQPQRSAQAMEEVA